MQILIQPFNIHKVVDTQHLIHKVVDTQHKIHLFYLSQVVRLLYHLVKFGYYLDAEDVKNLLPPLLNLLDGRHDYPYPKEKDKDKKEKGNKRYNYQNTKDP